MEQREKIEELFSWADKKARPVSSEQQMSALQILCQQGEKTRQKIKMRQMKILSDFILNRFKKYNQKIKAVCLNSAPGEEKFLTLNFKTTGGFSMKCGIDAKTGCCLIDGLLGGVNGISVSAEKTSFSVFEENLLKPVLVELAEKWLAQFNIGMDENVKTTFEIPNKDALCFEVKTHQNTGKCFWQLPAEIKNIVEDSVGTKIKKQQFTRHIDVAESFYTQNEAYLLKDILAWEKGKKIIFKTKKTVAFIAGKKINTGVLKENNKKLSIVLEKTDFS